MSDGEIVSSNESNSPNPRVEQPYNKNEMNRIIFFI